MALLAVAIGALAGCAATGPLSPETRAGDFSCARAGIDQKIPAYRTGPADPPRATPAVIPFPHF